MKICALQTMAKPNYITKFEEEESWSTNKILKMVEDLGGWL